MFQRNMKFFNPNKKSSCRGSGIVLTMVALSTMAFLSIAALQLAARIHGNANQARHLVDLSELRYALSNVFGDARSCEATFAGLDDDKTYKRDFEETPVDDPDTLAAKPIKVYRNGAAEDLLVVGSTFPKNRNLTEPPSGSLIIDDIIIKIEPEAGGTADGTVTISAVKRVRDKNDKVLGVGRKEYRLEFPVTLIMEGGVVRNCDMILGDPENLNATPVSDTQIDLTWDAGQGATGYWVSYLQGAAYPNAYCTNGTSVDAGNVLTYQMLGLTASMLYSIRVCSYDGHGKRSYGATVQETTLPVVPPPPPPPPGGEGGPDGFDLNVNYLAAGNSSMFVQGSFGVYKANSAPRSAKFDLAGNFDSSFPVGTGWVNAPSRVKGDNNEFYWWCFSGLVPTYDGNNCDEIGRLDESGNFDTGFTIDTDNNVFDLAFTPTHIFVVGSFTQIKGKNDLVWVPRNGIAKVSRVDGTVDPTFVPDPALPPAVGFGYKKALVSGGQLWVIFGGADQDVAYVLSAANGTKDPGFNAGTNFDRHVSSMVEKSAGKVYLAGDFRNYNGTSARGVVLLNSDGSIDGSFDTTTGFDTLGPEPQDLKLHPSGGLLVSTFCNVTWKGTTVNGLFKLDDSANVDLAFNANIGTGTCPPIAGGGSVNAIAIDASNKIWIGGWFIDWNGGSVTDYIHRLNLDGTSDPLP